MTEQAAQILPEAQTPAPEGQAPEAQAQETPRQDPASKAFLALAKREKALQRERMAIRAEKDEIAKIRAEMAALRQETETLKAKPKSPREALERYGFSYKDATDYELNDGQPTAEQIARMAQEDVKRLREEKEDERKRSAEEKQRLAKEQEEAVVEEFKGEISDFVKEHAEDYELIGLHDAQNLVYDVTEAHFIKTQRVLSIKEAADLVEKWLEEQAERTFKAKKFTAKGQPAPSGERSPLEGSPKAGLQGEKATAQRRTLDNSVSSTTPTLVSSSSIESERMKRALAALTR